MPGRRFHLAQANVARMRAALDDPSMAGFVARLESVNRAADAAAGFVWRLQTEAGDATAIRVFEDERILFNMSVWESVESLRSFVYDGSHLDVYRWRAGWFEPLGRRPYVLWWIRAGTLPTAAEGRRRLERLWEEGPGSEAFTFARVYPPPR